MEPNATFQIIHLDDHKVLRDGIRAIFLGDPCYKIVGSTGSLPEFKSLIETSKPDLCILDIHLGAENGLDVAKWLREKYPKIKVLIMTALHDKHVVVQCRNMGLEGIISKDSGKETIVEALECIRNGKKYFAGQFTDLLLQSSDIEKVLSDREIDFLKAFARGWSQKEIAEYLHISPRTVETHKKNVMDKLNIQNSVDLIKYALREGYASL